MTIDHNFVTFCDSVDILWISVQIRITCQNKASGDENKKKMMIFHYANIYIGTIKA